VVAINLLVLLHHDLLEVMAVAEMVLIAQVLNLEFQLLYLLLVLQTLAVAVVEDQYKLLLLLIILVFTEHLVQLVDLV
jgi:hypothetical protein